VTEAATKLEQAIQQAASQYFQLVILAGAPASGKTAALQSVAQKLDCQLVNVNLELSKRMLELTRTQRSRQVERLFKDVIAAVPGDVVLLDNLEILFDTASFAPSFEPKSHHRCVGVVVNFTPDRAIKFHLSGYALELLPRAFSSCILHTRCVSLWLAARK
jgi:hypothetical protein